MTISDLDSSVLWKRMLDANETLASIDRQDIERQYQTAAEVIRRFGTNDYPAVLLADEVGMGKTYVALAAVATTLQSHRNARVLLVVPQSEVLKKKWLQDIGTFQANYIDPKFADMMKPVEVDDLLDLVCATNEYKNISIQRLQRDSELMYVFLLELSRFAGVTTHRYSGFISQGFKKWLSKLGMTELNPWQCEGAYQKISRFALHRYFQSDRTWDDVVRQLNSDKPVRDLSDRVKTFLKTQEQYLPNIFLFRMNKLLFPKKNNEQMRNFGSALLDVLCSNREEPTVLDVIGNLQDSFIWPVEQLGYKRMCPAYISDLRKMPEPFGLRNFLRSQNGRDLVQDFKLARKNEDPIGWHELYSRLREGNNSDLGHKYLCGLRTEIVRRLLARNKFSLCVVDEVHNWKSGTSNGASEFADLIRGTISNVLLMSATPFQIDPLEFKTIYDVAISLDKTSKTSRALEKLYNEDGGIVPRCIARSKVFHETWSKLSDQDIGELNQAFQGLPLENDTTELLKMLSTDVGSSSNLVEFSKAALSYAVSLRDLSTHLKDLVIRHTKERVRRASGKPPSSRHFHSGNQYSKIPIDRLTHQVSRIPTVKGYISDSEDLALFEFIAMRFDQLLRDKTESQRRGSQGRKAAAAHLMNGLTSSFSAFRESQTNKQVALLSSPEIDAYKICLNKLCSDGLQIHPKVEATRNRLLANWKIGRKTLVFCYRVATVLEIVSTVNEQIRLMLEDLSKPYPFLTHDLSGTLRRNYLFREDRIWLSLLVRNLAKGANLKSDTHYLETVSFLKSKEASAILSSTAESFGRGVKDRQRRLMFTLDALCLKRFLIDKPDKNLNAPNWLSKSVDDMSIPELAELLDKATVARRPQSEKIAVEDTLEDSEEELKKSKFQVREESLSDFVEKYLEIQSVWFSDYPNSGIAVQTLHTKLWELWDDEVESNCIKEDNTLNKDLAFWLRGQIVKAVRNVVLRPDVVIRLMTDETCRSRLNSKSDLATHFPLLTEQLFIQKLGGQTIMNRVTDFLDELLKAAGSIDIQISEESRRKALFGGALLKHDKDEPTVVKSLTGKVSGDRRSQICQAFNSPLLPDALVCTSIGQEGIDLHLYCADVIHHDLPWNPAVLEQRTGRVDRVRSLSERDSNLFIQIGVPFLGNNYDQFQYDVLVERAQKFDILMGDESVKQDWQQAEAEAFQDEDAPGIIDDWVKPENESQASKLLPEALLNFLTLDLSVWPQAKNQKSSVEVLI